MKFGVIDKRCNPEDGYSFEDRLHLIRCLEAWGASLYVVGSLSWKNAHRPFAEPEKFTFLRLADECHRRDIEIWAWMKPGDKRYCHNKKDRSAFVDNVCRYLDIGANGFYLLMDDMHTTPPKIRAADAEVHALLIEEISSAVGEKFKGICGQHYQGRICNSRTFAAYWRPILRILPRNTGITWTGIKTWNRTIAAEELPKSNHPIILWDNYFASDSPEPSRAPIYPYAGRDPQLAESLAAVLIHPNCIYAWQYCALHTAMSFWRSPGTYVPDQAFHHAVLDLSTQYRELQY